MQGVRIHSEIFFFLDFASLAVLIHANTLVLCKHALFLMDNSLTWLYIIPNAHHKWEKSK